MRRMALRRTAAPSIQLLLDEYPNAAAAYSLRDLSTAFVGSPVVRVRRSSDNVEQDFTSVQVTDGTLETFVGAGNDGFVTTWYDQSGNSVNLVQATAASQPQLVDNGLVILDNGRPTVFYSDSDNSIINLKTTTGVVINQPTSYFSLARMNVGTSFLFDSLNSSTDRQIFFEAFGANNFSMSSGISLILTENTNEFNNLFSLIFNGSNSSGRINGIEEIFGDAGNKIQEWGTLGRIYNQNKFNVKSICEFIIYPNNQTQNQIGIETNIKNYYLNTPTSGILKDYPNASVAYSLRNLSNKTTNVVRVRRSSDNQEQDFAAIDITDGTLESWVGAGNDGFVTVWYNQATNLGVDNQDVSQTVASRQPKIVNNGLVETKNNKPTISFNRSNLSSLFGNKISKLDSPNDYCSFGVASLNDNNVGGVLFSNTATNFQRIASYLSSNTNSVLSDTPILNDVNLENNLNLITSYRSGAIFNGRTNGIELSPLTAPNDYQNDRLSIGIQFNNNAAIDGTISEIIIYPSDQAANRTGIETNINNEYTIY